MRWSGHAVGKGRQLVLNERARLQNIALDLAEKLLQGVMRTCLPNNSSRRARLTSTTSVCSPIASPRAAPRP